jgi:hypothetical protein
MPMAFPVKSGDMPDFRKQCGESRFAGGEFKPAASGELKLAANKWLGAIKSA